MGEYSILGNELKEEITIQIKMCDKGYLAFAPYYHELPNWYNTGYLYLLIFDST